MLQIPDRIKELYRKDNLSKETHKEYKLSFYESTIDTLYPHYTLFPDQLLFPANRGEPWLVIENNKIVSESLVITESLCESEDLEFGSCEAAMMEIIVADIIYDLTGKEFELTVAIDGFDISLGTYTIESFVRQADRRKRKITAYNRMRRFNVDVAAWYNSLTFPMPLRKFRDSLCNYIGIMQEEITLLFDSMEISKTIEPETISGLDVLQAICQINGCFGQVDKSGVLKYIHLEETGLYPSEDLFPSEDLYPDEFGEEGVSQESISTYRKMQYEDYVVESITGLTIREQEGDIGANVGESGNVYIIEGNFLVYGKTAVELLSIAESLLPLISNRVYCPAQVECNGLPWVEVGDALQIITRDDIIETFCMKRTMSGCQALKDKYESTGTEKRENTIGINRKIIQLEGKAAILVANVDEVSATVTDLKNYTESQFKITADAITAEVTRAQSAENVLSSKITQTAEEIRLEVSNTAEGLQSQITQNADEISLKVSVDSLVDDLNSELTISGNMIELTTGHFIVDSRNFSLDSNGNAEFSGDISGSSIYGAYIEGTEIYGGTIWNGYMEITEDSCYIGNWSFENLGSSDTYFEGRGISIHAGSGNIDSNGDFWCDNLTCNNLNNNSDIRLKTNIKKIDASKAKEFVMGLKPRTYLFKESGTPGIGFIAQDVKKLSEEIGFDAPVFGRNGEFYTIPYQNYIPLLALVLQEQEKRIAALERRTS